MSNQFSFILGKEVSFCGVTVVLWCNYGAASLGVFQVISYVSSAKINFTSPIS